MSANNPYAPPTTDEADSPTSKTVVPCGSQNTRTDPRPPKISGTLIVIVVFFFISLGTISVCAPWWIAF